MLNNFHSIETSVRMCVIDHSRGEYFVRMMFVVLHDYENFPVTVLSLARWPHMPYRYIYSIWHVYPWFLNRVCLQCAVFVLEQSSGSSFFTSVCVYHMSAPTLVPQNTVYYAHVYSILINNSNRNDTASDMRLVYLMYGEGSMSWLPVVCSHKLLKPSVPWLRKSIDVSLISIS